MEPGSVSMKMPFWSLNFGLSSKELYFDAAQGRRQLVIRSPAREVQAARCESCGAVLILSGKPA
jgi:hypothetical protein